MSELHLKIIGSLLILISLVHVIFPKYFSWKTELNKLSMVNAQIMRVHTFFIALTVCLMGVLCFFYSQLLIHSELGRIICKGLAIFWGTRLVFQFFVYSPKLWLGKPFETSVHIAFSLIWAYLSFCFWWFGFMYIS